MTGGRKTRIVAKAIFHVIVVVAVSSSLADVFGQDQKTDVVVMNNGDRMVGEIKKLQFGKLDFKASYMDSSVQLDWTKVRELASMRRFRVEFDDGALYTGTIRKLDTPSREADFEVIENTGTTTGSFLSVVVLEPLEGSIWRRFEGSADVGLTLHPEAGLTQFSANADIAYPEELYRVDSQLNSLFSRQEGSEDSLRRSLAVTYTRFLKHNWILLGSIQTLKDNQLNLDLRVTAQGGGGRFLVHTSRTGLAWSGGIAWTNEKYFDTTQNDNGNKAESFLGVQFFTYRFGSSQLTTRLLLYSGITQWGRQRVDWQANISWEIWKDIYWRISMIENFDSRPPEGASNNDFTLTSSVGISF